MHVTKLEVFFTYFLITAFFLILLWVGQFGFSIAKADYLFIEPRSNINKWVKNQQIPTFNEWKQAQQKLKKSIEITPHNPVLHEYIASLYSIRGSQYWSNETLRNAYFLDALDHQNISLDLRPTNGRTWAGKALSLHALNNDEKLLIKAMTNAIKYSPYDKGVQKQVISIATSRWDRMPSNVKNWAISLYADTSARNRLRLDELSHRFKVKLN